MKSKKITVLLLPDQSESSRFTVHLLHIRLVFLAFLVFSLLLGYFTIDYLNMHVQRESYLSTQQENTILKSEAQLLIQNLDNVKKSLTRVHDYTKKINDLVNVKVNTVKSKTGIGPLSEREFRVEQAQKQAEDLNNPIVPLGIDTEKLTFRPVFSSLANLHMDSNRQAIELQQAMTSLSQQKSMLASIPTIMPTRGWIASGFGRRVSPFFPEETSIHRGVDIAAPVGTAIRAPADGVVIFSDVKKGFGNFVVIAHYDNGIVTKYGHNSENMVTVGQRVSRGDQIASVGMTGNTTGPHVHYEVWLNGEPVNPEDFFLYTDITADIGIF